LTRSKDKILDLWPGTKLTERDLDNGKRWLSAELPFTRICPGGPFAGKSVTVEYADIFQLPAEDEPHWADILSLAPTVVWTAVA
jgi:hypothetical protein